MVPGKFSADHHNSSQYTSWCFFMSFPYFASFQEVHTCWTYLAASIFATFHSAFISHLCCLTPQCFSLPQWQATRQQLGYIASWPKWRKIFWWRSVNIYKSVQMFIGFLKSILERILIGKLVYFSRLTIGFQVELSWYTYHKSYKPPYYIIGGALPVVLVMF